VWEWDHIALFALMFTSVKMMTMMMMMMMMEVVMAVTLNYDCCSTNL